MKDIQISEEFVLSSPVEFGGKDLVRGDINSLPGSMPLANLRKMKEMEDNGEEVYRFGFGQSPFPPPDCLIEKLASTGKYYQYGSSVGYPYVRQTVASWFSRRLKRKVNENDILVGPGAKYLIYQLLMSFNGTVLVPGPSWPSYTPIALLSRNPCRWIVTSYSTKWHVTAEMVEKAASECTTYHKLLMLNYPDNLGLTYTKEEMEEIAEVCRRHNIVVLADEIYSAFQWTDEGYHSMAQILPEKTIVLEGISKWAGSGGWRLGVSYFPDELKPLMNCCQKLGTQTYTSASNPIQFAAAEAFKESEVMDKYLAHSVKLVRTLVTICYEKLISAGFAIREPEGSFYLFLDFSPFKAKLKSDYGVFDSQSLCQAVLAETNICLLSSASMALNEDSLTARMACTDFDGEYVLKKSYEIPLDEEYSPEFISEHFSKTFRGIDRMIDFVRGKKNQGHSFN